MKPLHDINSILVSDIKKNKIKNLILIQFLFLILKKKTRIKKNTMIQIIAKTPIYPTNQINTAIEILLPQDKISKKRRKKMKERIAIGNETIEDVCRLFS